MARISTRGHWGAIGLKCESNTNFDCVTYIHKSKKVSEDYYTWRFTGKRKMVLLPNKVYIEEEGKKHDPKKWQPDAIYVNFTSTVGCEFNLILNFISEDEQAERRAKLEAGGDLEKKMV